jgi:uncharacterized protein
MSRVIHFEIPTDNPARTSKFYAEVFGWKFELWPGPQPYWLINTGTEGPGINGGMLPRTPLGAVNTIGAASVDDTLKAVEASGGKVVMPKFAVPTIGWLAYFSDTEGTVFGVMQTDPAAA